MNRWLLWRLEMGADERFYEWELKMHCRDFDELLSSGLLIRDLEAEKSEFCFTRWGRRLQLLRIDGAIFGADVEDPEEPIARVDPKELIRYRFNWEAWLNTVRERNGLSGSLTWLHERLCFLGDKMHIGRKVGFVLGFYNHEKRAMDLLLSLPVRLPSGFDAIAVTTLVFDRLPQQNIASLERLRVYVVPPINLETLEIDTSSVTLRACPLEPVSPCSRQHIQRTDAGALSLTAEQKRDYDLYEYNCRLPIHLTGKINRAGNNEVLVADTAVEIGDVPFLLFLRLLLELRRNKAGIVPKVDLRSEGYFGEGTDDQSINRLRNCFVRALGNLDKSDFIEIYRRKTVRLSVHPDLVTWNAEKLSAHDDSRVKELVRQLLQTGQADSSLPTVNTVNQALSALASVSPPS